MNYIFFILLFLVPILFSVFLNMVFNKNNSLKIKEDVYFLMHITCKLTNFIIIFCFAFFTLSNMISKEFDMKLMILNISYLIILFSFIVFINYFGTNYFKFRICIKTFLESLHKFISENFILNLLIFILLVFIIENKDLTLGIVGSYFFFALTSIHEEYKKNIDKNNRNFGRIYVIAQYLLNFFILRAFLGIEKILVQYSQDSIVTIEFDYTISVLVLLLVISLNFFLPRINFFCKKMIKHCKKSLNGGTKMSGGELDSSINDYIENEKTKNYIKQLQWDMAIGLQEVDNLKPSKYLEKLLQENIKGEKTIYEVEHELKQYYVEKDKRDKTIQDEFKCDLVSTRIVQLLEENNFELSVDYIKYSHEHLFKDVCEYAGEFRKVAFLKQERILNNDSVAYGDCNLLEQSLEYDILLEKDKNYEEMNIVDVINNITNFSSNIWQIHPFREGNTITTALFIEKYLVSLGYDVNNTMFKEKSVYYRNALVRSNYFNNYLNIKQDNSFLIKFYENLLLGKNNNLHSRDLIVEELFNKEN